MTLLYGISTVEKFEKIKIFRILLYLTQLSYPAQSFILTLTEDDLVEQENRYKHQIWPQGSL